MTRLAIGFDANDTLWYCENTFAHTQARFAAAGLLTVTEIIEILALVQRLAA